MKRILHLTFALAAFFLLKSLPVLAIDRPFDLNGQEVATFITDGAENLIDAGQTPSSTATHLVDVLQIKSLMEN